MLKMFLDSLDGLDEGTKALYEPHGEGKFRLKLEGYEDPEALRRAKQHEVEARKAAQAEVRQLKEDLEALRKQIEESTDDKHKKKGDIEALERSYKEKIERIEREHQARLGELTSHLEKVYVEDVAYKLATEVSSVPDAAVALLKPRLKFELGPNGPETRVLDASGNLTAMTVEELGKEFKADKRYAGIVIGSNASGGGATNSTKPGGGATKAFADMSEKERTELFARDPVEFRRQAAEFKKSQSGKK